jgi:aryl-alcohol dehydrogenase-like predicted oxidoreductase
MAVLGLGLAALGRPGYATLRHAEDLPSVEPAALEAQAHAVLDAAWAAGVRHVDTARSYGRGEAFLSSWLRTRQPQGAFISSKWGYRYTADWQRTAAVHEVKDHSLAHFERQWPETEVLLGPWLSLYQVHSATLDTGVLEDRALHARLATLRQRGVEVGVTVTGPRQPELLARALDVEVEGAPLFTWVQATWNVLEPSAGPMLAEAKRRGRRTIAKEALASGLLSSRGQWAPWLELAAHADATPDALALAVALAQPFLDVVLSGAATVAQLASNLRARALETDGVPWQGLARDPATYWQDRAKLAWT